MNITIYTTSDFPYGGAPENFVRQMAIGLHECGESVKVIRLRGSMYGGENKTPVLCSNLLFKKRPKNEILKFLELIFIIVFTPFSVIQHKHKYNTNAIILYGAEYSYYSIPFLLTSKLLGIKIYRVIADYYDRKTIIPVWWKRPKVFFYERQFTYVDKHFTGIIVLSNYLQEHAIKCGVSRLRILLIPHFIDVLSFSAETSSGEQPQLKKIIGFCGTPNEANGIIDLIEAFQILYKKHSNLELLIIGNPNKKIKMILEGLTLSTSHHNISYTGYLKINAVIGQLNKCTILVNPRRAGRFAEAGFPTKLGEYFATRKPVVATVVGDLKHYFENENQLILVEPDSPQALADGIAFLLQNQQQAIKIGQNGYIWAKENLDYKNNVKKLITFIE